MSEFQKKSGKCDLLTIHNRMLRIGSYITFKKTVTVNDFLLIILQMSTLNPAATVRPLRIDDVDLNRWLMNAVVVRKLM